jgi:predicted DNA-binding transcriptional regulator YafY
MYNPTTRLLTILELLQVHGALSGVDLAERLEVDVRTIRRYITMLQDMAIPVESERGRHGTYFLRPGYKLPPLMFGEEEALAITLGLLMTRRLGISDATGAEGALAKVVRVLPENINTTAQALAEVLVFDLPVTRATPDRTAIITVSVATYRGEQVTLHYRAFSGAESTRVLDPYGVAYRAGFWYLVGYCHLRQDLRTFRMERVVAVERITGSLFDRPPEFDVLAFVEQSIANTPGVWTVDVRLNTTIETARQLIPRAMGLPEQQGNEVILRCHIQDLNWFAYFLSRLDCPVQILNPPAARDEIRRLAERIGQLSQFG